MTSPKITFSLILGIFNLALNLSLTVPPAAAEAVSIQQDLKEVENEINALSEEEMQIRLTEAVTAINEMTLISKNLAVSLTTVNLTAEETDRLQKISNQLQQLAASGKIKKVLKGGLKVLKRIGQTGLYTFAFAGSTIHQLTLAPLYALSGLLYGLSTGNVDLDGSSYSAFLTAGGGVGTIVAVVLMITEIILISKKVTPYFYYIYVFGLITESVTRSVCHDSATFTDTYSSRFCKFYDYYRFVIVNSTSQATSFVGSKIRIGVQKAANKIAPNRKSGKPKKNKSEPSDIRLD